MDRRAGQVAKFISVDGFTLARVKQ